MTDKYNEFELFIRNILAKGSIMKKQQLILCLCRYYSEIYPDTAEDIINHAQKKGILLVSTDGYVMTKGAYSTLTGDTYGDDLKLDEDVRIKQPININGGRTTGNTIDCMWIVANMMPDSNNFIVCPDPWNIQFIVQKNDDPAKLFQVMRITKDKEIPSSIMLKNMANDIDKKMRLQIRRIVLLDDDSFAWRFPKVGVTHIAVIDEKVPNGFRIVEKRKPEEAWSDYGN